jgi:hypothetical protein
MTIAITDDYPLMTNSIRKLRARVMPGNCYAR